MRANPLAVQFGRCVLSVDNVLQLQPLPLHPGSFIWGCEEHLLTDMESEIIYGLSAFKEGHGELGKLENNVHHEGTG